MKKIRQYFNKIEEVLAVSILFYMLLILTYQVMLRFIFKSSNAWSEETARYLFVWFVYVTASLAILRNAHIRIDAFLKVYPQRMMRAVVIAGHVLFLGYCLVIVWYSAAFTGQIMDTEQVSLGLGTPMWLVWISLPICHGLMAIRIVQRMYHIWFLHEPFAAVTPDNAP